MKGLIASLLRASGAAGAGELYVEAGMAHQFNHSACHDFSTIEIFVSDEQGPQPWTPSFCKYDRWEYHPQLAHAEIGVSQQLGPRLVASLYARHESIPGVHDFGVNQAGIKLRLTVLRWGAP